MHSINPTHPQPKYTSCPLIRSSSAKTFIVALGVISLLAGLAASYYFYPSMGLPALGFGGAGGVIAVITTALVAYQRKEVDVASRAPIYPACDESTSNEVSRTPINLACDESTSNEVSRTPINLACDESTSNEVSRTPIYLSFDGSISFARLRAQNHGVPPYGMSDYTLFEAGKVQSYQSQNDPRMDKAMGVMLGMAVGDSVGAPYASLPYKQTKYQENEAINRFNLKPGQWTGDTSMGLCLADVLYCGYNDTQLLWALYDWANHAYNTPFTNGEYHRPIGVETTVAHSLTLFDQANVRRDDTTDDRPTEASMRSNISSSSSLVRNGPVVLAARTEEEAMKLAFRQSKTTHRGDEAATCCELMAKILYNLVNTSVMDKEDLFLEIQQFECTVESVNLIAQSKGEYVWLSADFTLQERPENAGSYVPNALAMALHCVFTTDSFENAVLKAATRGGLANSLAAITGQIAGAFYGKGAIPPHWVDAVQQWDRGGEIAARAVLLSNPLALR